MYQEWKNFIETFAYTAAISALILLFCAISKKVVVVLVSWWQRRRRTNRNRGETQRKRQQRQQHLKLFNQEQHKQHQHHQSTTEQLTSPAKVVGSLEQYQWPIHESIQNIAYWIFPLLPPLNGYTHLAACAITNEAAIAIIIANDIAAADASEIPFCGIMHILHT